MVGACIHGYFANNRSLFIPSPNEKAVTLNKSVEIRGINKFKIVFKRQKILNNSKEYLTIVRMEKAKQLLI